MELLETLSANFNEKCVIAANDVSFPSNRARFSNRIQFWKDFRYVIYRSPSKLQTCYIDQHNRFLKTLHSCRRTVEYQRISLTHA